MDNAVRIDAGTFQEPLGKLANTMILKVEREAIKLPNIPTYTAIDIGILLRMSKETLNLLWYLNADETLEPSSTAKPVYTIVVAPLVRNMIDALYNITYILKDPVTLGLAFRLSGLMKDQKMVAAEEKRYAGKPEWDTWIKESRDKIDLQMRQMKVTQVDIDATVEWPTLGKYLNTKGKGGNA